MRAPEQAGTVSDTQTYSLLLSPYLPGVNANFKSNIYLLHITIDTWIPILYNVALVLHSLSLIFSRQGLASVVESIVK